MIQSHPDTDSGSSFHFPHHCRIAYLRDLSTFLTQSPADFHDTRRNDWRRRDNESGHFRSYMTDIRVRIPINSEIRIQIPDHFRLRLDALAAVCDLWAQFITSDKGGGICYCLRSFVCLSVCLSACEQDYSKTPAWTLMKCCVSTDVGTWTNWSTFEPDPDHSLDARTGLLSPISYVVRCNAEFYYVRKIPV